jgi:glycosyltransferase involved in cell wall biosynthesis
MNLSVVMPCFNERDTIREIVRRVLSEPHSKELIVVDDGSTDGTRDILRELASNHPEIRLIFHEKNSGKGAALRTGFASARGDVVLVQDADLEYDPNEYSVLLAPIEQGQAEVVFGSRFLSGPRRVLYYWHSVANRLLTTFSNMVTDLNLTDMETCYKVFRREVLDAIVIEEERFGFEPEIVAKVARLKGLRIYEVPISYAGRTYAEGKKIGWKDAVRAVYAIGKYGLVQRGDRRDWSPKDRAARVPGSFGNVTAPPKVNGQAAVHGS